jgi:hypothetical protein
MNNSVKDLRPGELFILASNGEIFEYMSPGANLHCGSSMFHWVTLRRDQHMPGGTRHVIRPATLTDIADVLPGAVAKQYFQAIADAMDDWIAR